MTRHRASRSRAALHPANVPYLFYVTGKDGSHALRDDARGARARTSRARRTGRSGRSDARRRDHAIAGAHRRSRRALALARDPQRRVRGSRARLGVRRVPGARGVGAATRCRRCAALGLAGLSVTMPHKADAARACDELTPDADRARRGQRGHRRSTTAGCAASSTDGEGFLRSVRDEGVDPAGADVLVLGAGGAARGDRARARATRARAVTVAARRRDAGRRRPPGSCPAADGACARRRATRARSTSS